jgi:exodeoxyribonuclease VII small subunit
MSFTEDMERLQDVTIRLEREQLPLEEALALFEEGVAVVRRCERFLSEARQKVTLLASEEGREEEGQEILWDPLEEEKDV